MATEGTPHPKASGETSPPTPGVLALLTATALGGIVGSRVGVRPLAVAAGAAALALLNRERKPAGHPPAVPAPPLAGPLPTTFPQPREPEVDPRIEDWLARQMDREVQAAALDAVLPEAAAVPPPAFFSADEAAMVPDGAAAPEEDDYRPEPLLPDAPASGHAWEADSFAGLTEPPVSRSAPFLPSPPASVPTPAPAVATGPAWAGGLPSPPPLAGLEPFTAATFPPYAPAPPDEIPRPVFATFNPSTPPLFPPDFPLAAEGLSIPGIEPLPSWSEAVAPPPEPAGDLDLESLFNPPPFQSSPQADEHSGAPPPPVVLATEHAQPSADPMASFFQAPGPFTSAPKAPVNETPVPEIAVHIAAAGEAWFDSPLADVPNPWLPPKIEDEPPLTPPAPGQAPVPGPVVEAEIVLRPRAPVQAAVVPKNLPPAPKSPETDVEVELAANDPELPRAPVQTPREQRARSTWRSWWRGD